MPTSADQLLSRLMAYKQADAGQAELLGPEMTHFFKQSVEKRQGKLARFAECSAGLIPETLSEHCALHSFTRGTLTVLVDSSSHLYDLKQLLLAGMQDQLMFACRSAGLRKIVLKPGQAQWLQDTRRTNGRVR